jgi:hypothetical protein
MADVSDLKPSDLKEITDSLEALSCKFMVLSCVLRLVSCVLCLPAFIYRGHY